MTFLNPFDVDPKQSTIEDRMYAMYAVLKAHETASGKGCELPLDTGVSRGFNMNYWDCGTAACAAGSAGLVPWFQEVAKSLNIELEHEKRAKGPGELVDSAYLCDPRVWGYIHNEMRDLFWGNEGVYTGIINPATQRRFDGDTGRYLGLNMKSLTPTQVKQALRRIIVKHFGKAGATRCDELDKHCNLIAE